MILVVDDEPEMNTMLSVILFEDGFEVLTFPDAEEALQFVSVTEPELIISDIVMPGLDGYQFMQQYRDQFPNRTTPFLFLSSLRETEHIVHGLTLGAHDYLTKPIRPKILLAKIHRHLTIKAGYESPSFHGELSKFPFYSLLKFCEVQKFTGTIELSSSCFQCTVHFQAGNLLIGDDSELLERALDLRVGIFVLKPTSVDFRALQQIKRLSKTEARQES